MGELLRANLEVALPLRDRGIDLVVYADLGDKVRGFRGCPIQMKAAMKTSFSIDRKYAKFPGLLIAYVWYLSEPLRSVIYALSFDEAVAVAREMGYTTTASWEKGLYTNTRPSPELVAKLEPFKMTPARWWSKVTGLEGS